MAKINNKIIYALEDLPSLLDYLIGSKDKNGKTRNFSLQSIVNIINGVNAKNVIQYQFFNELTPDVDYTTPGAFFSNNDESDVNNFTSLIFNKKTLGNYDLSILFDFLSEIEDLFIGIDNPSDPNNFFTLRVTSISNQTDYFIFEVEPYNGLYIGDLTNEFIYSIIWETKEWISEINQISENIDNKEDKSNKGVANGYAPLDNFIKISNEYLNIINDLTTGGVSYILSAEQGKVLQNQINAINTLLSSDNVDLDTFQEIVNEIEKIQNQVNNISINDATTLAKGIIKLSGDLSGTADAPTVPGLANKADLINGLVKTSQLPSYVDDVLEFTDLASFPIIGETGKIYIDLDNNLTYRWSGSVYVKIGSSDALWGNILGNILNQTDLQNELNAKLTATLATDAETQINAAVTEDNKVTSRLKLFNWWVWQKTRAQVFGSSVQAQSFNTGGYIDLSLYYATFTANASKRMQIDAVNSRILGQNGTGTNSIYFSPTTASVNQYIPNSAGNFLLDSTLNSVRLTQFQKSSFEPLYIRVNNFTSDVLEDLRINVASGNNRPFFERCITANASKGAGTWERCVSTLKVNNSAAAQGALDINALISFQSILATSTFNWSIDTLSSRSGALVDELISSTGRILDVDNKTTNEFRITFEFSFTAGAGDGSIELSIGNPNGIVIDQQTEIINADGAGANNKRVTFKLRAVKTTDNNTGYNIILRNGSKALTSWKLVNILRTNN
jgi:hypothetical protein